MEKSDFQILGIFSLLSVIAVGGGTSVLPEMKNLTIDTMHWLNADQFRDIYSLGQIVPGPNMMMVMVIGYKVAGMPGALLAFGGFFIPSALIAFVAARIWNHFEGSEWRLAIQRGMAPIVVGLMAGGAVAIARTAIVGSWALAFAMVTFFILYFGKKRINPAILIISGGIFGILLMRE